MQERGWGVCDKGEREGDVLCAQPPNALFTQPTTSDGILIIIRKHTYTHTQRRRGSGGGKECDRDGNTDTRGMTHWESLKTALRLRSCRPGAAFPTNSLCVCECPAFLCVHVCICVCAFCLRKLNLKYASDLLFTFFYCCAHVVLFCRTNTHTCTRAHTESARVCACMCVYGWLCLFVWQSVNNCK